MKERKRVHFEELQRFDQGWFIALMAVSSLATLVPLAIGVYIQFVLNKPWGNEPLSDLGLLLLVGGMVLILIGANVIVFSSRLETKVDNDGVNYRYWPLIRNWIIIDRNAINNYQIKKYRTIMDFGGWGYRMRFIFNRKRAFHIKGNMGLSIELSGGKTVLLGTQKPDMLRSAMKKLMKPEEDF